MKYYQVLDIEYVAMMLIRLLDSLISRAVMISGVMKRDGSRGRQTRPFPSFPVGAPDQV
jgi:hypothetical protein